MGEIEEWWNNWTVTWKNEEELNALWEGQKTGKYFLERGIYGEPIFLKKVQTMYPFATDVPNSGNKNIIEMLDADHLEMLRKIIEDARTRKEETV